MTGLWWSCSTRLHLAGTHHDLSSEPVPRSLSSLIVSFILFKTAHLLLVSPVTVSE
jgi:hypothetical protein